MYRVVKRQILEIAQTPRLEFDKGFSKAVRQPLALIQKL